MCQAFLFPEVSPQTGGHFNKINIISLSNSAFSDPRKQIYTLNIIAKAFGLITATEFRSMSDFISICF